MKKSKASRRPFLGQKDLQRLTRAQALAVCPVKNQDVKENVVNDALIQLTYYVTTRPWFSKYAQKLGMWDGKPMAKRLELDTIGTMTWKWIDGHRTVSELIKLLAETFSLHEREAEVSMTAFLRQLGKRGIIGFK